MWRTGDHHRRGLLLAVGPGIAPGRRAGTMSRRRRRAHARGVARPRRSILRRCRTRRPAPRCAYRDSDAAGITARYGPARARRRRRWSTQKMDADPHAWIEKYAIGLSQSIHVLHLTTGELEREVERLRQVASITEVGAWLRMLDVPESLLVSIVMPTRNRADRLERAIDVGTRAELRALGAARRRRRVDRRHLDTARRRWPTTIPASVRSGSTPNSGRRRRATRRSTTPRAM